MGGAPVLPPPGQVESLHKEVLPDTGQVENPSQVISLSNLGLRLPLRATSPAVRVEDSGNGDLPVQTLSQGGSSYHAATL